ncbi:C2 calcium/lipid-binding plant phosphoribosyltransferase family protein, partial [Perilla frutescens var. hirtella]
FHENRGDSYFGEDLFEITPQFLSKRSNRPCNFFNPLPSEFHSNRIYPPFNRVLQLHLLSGAIIG